MTIYQELTNFENEAYQQYERTTGINLPKLPDGSYDIRNNGSIFHNNAVDAFRHAYVSGRFNQIYDENFVEALGYGVEIVRRNSPNERNMDLWNNNVGRELGNISNSSNDLGNLVKDALDRSALIINPSDQRKLPNSDSLLDNLGALFESMSAASVQGVMDFIKDHLPI